MFCIIKEYELSNYIWNKVRADQYIDPTIEIKPELIKNLNPNILLNDDIHLFFIDQNEGICGKVTLTHTSRQCEKVPLRSNDQPLTYSALIIKDIDYHVNGDSEIHENPDRFEELTYCFYREILKTALWITQKLSLKNIITISNIEDDHEDLKFWGEFSFIAEWKMHSGILGIINLDNLLNNVESIEDNIKTESHLRLISQ